ncbi:MAG: CheY-like chemotaxis protein [Chlamydiales bacterium]|jgi:CheY-like chemotaxis protein
MRLESLTCDHIRRAIEIYMAMAWPAGQEGCTPAPRPLHDLEGIEPLTEMFERFDVPAAGLGGSLSRHTLRLGNRRYPFMKFVVQEYLVHEEYFFSVDTHDALKITPNMADYETWQEVLSFNRQIKRDIERTWHSEGLPTNEDLRILMEELAQLEKEGEKKARLLVVDDEENVALGLRAVLGARGYEVEVAYDGRQVLDRMARDPLPDLVVLDYSMPELDGEEVLRQVRDDERCRDVPILLATASSIELSRLKRATGLLRKPYPRQLLFSMIGRILESRAGSAEQPAPPE